METFSFFSTYQEYGTRNKEQGQEERKKQRDIAIEITLESFFVMKFDIQKLKT